MVEKLIADDEEALAMFREATTGAKHVHSKKADADNVSIKPDASLNCSLSPPAAENCRLTQCQCCHSLFLMTRLRIGGTSFKARSPSLAF
jgi:hypothetical protein